MRSVLLCTLLTGCILFGGSDLTVVTSPIDDRGPTDTGDGYDFEHVSVEGYTQQKPGFRIVRSASDWDGAWNDTKEAHAPVLPGKIDLKSRMLFIATGKTEGAKTIEVQKITRTFNGLQIYVLETLPNTNCPIEKPKPPPIDIVALDAVPVDIHVHYDRVHAENCGPPPDAIVACRVAGSGGAGQDKMTSSPGEVIDCDSSQSRAQLGTIIDRGWQLLASPPGSATKLTIGKGNMGITFPVDAWGNYSVGLDVRDAAREGSGMGIVEVTPPEGGIELHFAKPVDPQSMPRVELHVVEMPWGFGTGNDCTTTAQKAWCEVHNVVSLQQAVVRFDEHKRYRVGVKYLDARLPGSPVVCVRAFPKGAPAVSTCDSDDATRKANAIWELGALDTARGTFYDAKLSKPPAPPVVATTTADAGAPMPTVTLPPPPPPGTHTIPPPPPPKADAGASVIEL